MSIGETCSICRDRRPGVGILCEECERKMSQFWQRQFRAFEDPALSLRDRFASQALVGFQVFVKGGWSGPMPEDMAEHVAENCYAIADAMLRVRDRKPVS